MSTVSQAPKVDTARTLNISNFNLLVVAALALAVAVIAGNAVAPTAQTVDRAAYMLYRQGEWMSVPVPANSAEAYQIFRLGEVASPLSNADTYEIFRHEEVVSVLNITNAEAYQLFRLGEWASVSAPIATVIDLTAYHLSERTMIPVQMDYSRYLESERTLVEVPDGVTIYVNSERTGIPVQFTAYHLSEWFGK
jgi:hypothetical protein